MTCSVQNADAVVIRIHHPKAALAVKGDVARVLWSCAGQRFVNELQELLALPLPTVVGSGNRNKVATSSAECMRHGAAAGRSRLGAAIAKLPAKAGIAATCTLHSVSDGDVAGLGCAADRLKGQCSRRGWWGRSGWTEGGGDDGFFIQRDCTTARATTGTTPAAKNSSISGGCC